MQLILVYIDIHQSLYKKKLPYFFCVALYNILFRKFLITIIWISEINHHLFLLLISLN